MTLQACVRSAVVPGAMATLALTAQAPAPRAEGSVIAPGAELEKLAGGFEFTQGPTSDRDANAAK